MKKTSRFFIALTLVSAMILSCANITEPRVQEISISLGDVSFLARNIFRNIEGQVSEIYLTASCLGEKTTEVISIDDLNKGNARNLKLKINNLPLGKEGELTVRIDDEISKNTDHPLYQSEVIPVTIDGDESVDVILDKKAEIYFATDDEELERIMEKIIENGSTNCYDTDDISTWARVYFLEDITLENFDQSPLEKESETTIAAMFFMDGHSLIQTETERFITANPHANYAFYDGKFDFGGIENFNTPIQMNGKKIEVTNPDNTTYCYYEAAKLSLTNIIISNFTASIDSTTGANLINQVGGNLELNGCEISDCKGNSPLIKSHGGVVVISNSEITNLDPAKQAVIFDIGMKNDNEDSGSTLILTDGTEIKINSDLYEAAELESGLITLAGATLENINNENKDAPVVRVLNGQSLHITDSYTQDYYDKEGTLYKVDYKSTTQNLIKTRGTKPAVYLDSSVQKYDSANKYAGTTSKIYIGGNSKIEGGTYLTRGSFINVLDQKIPSSISKISDIHLDSAFTAGDPVIKCNISSYPLVENPDVTLFDLKSDFILDSNPVQIEVNETNYKYLCLKNK